jgi:hypothetical protein
MSESVDVAVGVLDGKVVASWHEPVREITFDAKNAYQVSLALGRAAMEAHSGRATTDKELAFIEGELKQVKITVTDTHRDFIIAQVATIIRSLIDQKRSPGQIALHCVDAVLKETAR